MAKYLSVSRAARLVQVSRGILQQQIQNGKFTTFEGKIVVEDLLWVYP